MQFENNLMILVTVVFMTLIYAFLENSFLKYLCKSFKYLALMGELIA